MNLASWEGVYSICFGGILGAESELSNEAKERCEIDSVRHPPIRGGKGNNMLKSVQLSRYYSRNAGFAVKPWGRVWPILHERACMRVTHLHCIFLRNARKVIYGRHIRAYTEHRK